MGLPPEGIAREDSLIREAQKGRVIHQSEALQDLVVRRIGVR